MSTCNIKIYRTQLTPSRNALVDNLEGYLRTLNPTYYKNDFQYQQLGLDLTIKVNIDQSSIGKSNVGNYVRIEQDDRIWYYFILSAKWKGKKTVQLQLSIDSINTFRNDLHWTEKTTIARQHGDRFLQQIDNSFIRRIDPEGESIAAEKYRASVSNIREDGESQETDMEWYLMYRTRDSLTPDNIADPVGCYILGSKPIQIESGASGDVVVTAENLVTGMYYYFNRIDNPNGKVTINGQEWILGRHYYTQHSSEQTDWEDNVLSGIVMYKHPDLSLRFAMQFNKPVYAQTGVSNLTGFRSYTAPCKYEIKSDGEPYVEYVRCTDTETPVSRDSISSLTVNEGREWRVSSAFYQLAEQSFVSNEKYYTVAGQPYKIINDIYALDRTDSRIMKVLALPYAPCDVTYDAQSGNYTFPEAWSFEGGEMRLTDLNIEFINEIGNIKLPQFNTQNIQIPNGDQLIPEHDPNEIPTDERDILRESKLYHSDFYTYKAVYDSFAKEIQLEKFQPILTNEVYNATTTSIPVIYKHTNTINSKSLFKLDYKDLEFTQRFARYQQIEDYGEYLLIARNNEIPIYSNDYLNYIRTGYNYDLKAQELSKKQAVSSMAIEAAGAIANMYIGNYVGAAGNVKNALSSAKEKAATTAYEAYKQALGAEATIPFSTFQETANKYVNPSKSQLKAAGYDVSSTNKGLTAYGTVSIATSAAKGLSNSLWAQAQATNTREAQMASLAAQATSVAGADDLDLLNTYNGNRLQIMTYATKEYQKDAIADLFHYCGYAYPHMEYPNTTSRLWFNYIQCSPEFREEPNTPFQVYLDDIKARYAIGVTVYHCNGNTWDWDQEYENWEVMIYPEQSYVSNDSIQGFKCTELPGSGRYRITFDYLGKQVLNSEDNFIEIEIFNMFDEVMFARQVAATTGQHISITTGDFEEAPVYVRYRIAYLDKETEWQTVTLAGG